MTSEETGPPEAEGPLPGYQRVPGRDIDILPPQGQIPVSRGAPERRLARVNRYERRAALVERRVLGPATLALTFEVTDDQAFRFCPGYFIAIQADDEDLDKRRSPYCISSPPGDDRRFRLLVRLVSGGALSGYLSRLRPGELISFRGPSGRTMVPKDADCELLLLATGVGVGPFLSLCPHVLEQGYDGPIRLFWGLRREDDLCLVEELDDLATNFANFEYHISLSQPPPEWTGLRGRLTESVPGLLATLGGIRFYLVGNGAMIEEMVSALSDLGVDQRSLYQEAYFNIRHRASPSTLAEIRERFVATDLFSPYAHLEAGLYLPEASVGRGRGGDT
jgi:ferredoxin-NADP reductase